MGEAAAARQPSRGRMIAVSIAAGALVLLVLLVVAGLVGNNSVEIERLTGRVDTLEAVRTDGGSSTTASVLNADMRRLSSRIKALEAGAGSNAAVPRGAGTTTLAAAIQRISRRVETLERAAGETTPAAAVTTPAWRPAPAPRVIALADPGGGSLEMAGVRRALEVFGFTFQNSPLADGSPRTLGKKATTIVELFGAEYITEMFVMGAASEDTNVNGTILVGMGAVLGAATTWGPAWFNESMQGMIARVERAQRENTVTETRDGVTVELTINPQTNIFSLSVKPAGSGGSQ